MFKKNLKERTTDSSNKLILKTYLNISFYLYWCFIFPHFASTSTLPDLRLEGQELIIKQKYDRVRLGALRWYIHNILFNTPCRHLVLGTASPYLECLGLYATYFCLKLTCGLTKHSSGFDFGDILLLDRLQANANDVHLAKLHKSWRGCII